jgi:hypothetical protein
MLKTGSVMMIPLMISDIIQMETSSDDSKPFDGGGNVPIPVPVDRTEGVAKEVGDQGDVKVQVQVNEGNAPVDEGGGAVLVLTDVRAALPASGGGAEVLVPVDSKGGTVHIQVTERRAMTKYAGGGGVHDCVFDDHVDAEAEFNKEIGTAACSRTVEEILMTKQDWFVHATADEEFAVPKYGIAAGEGAVNAPVEQEVDLTNNHDDQVSVEKGAVLTKMEVTVGDLIVVHRGGDAIDATVDVEAELTKKVGTTEGLHTMEGFIMTNHLR